tara:strand:- start:131 stop:277 length:147 start_codon:yes stop_codon:yes gene_type:complete
MKRTIKWFEVLLESMGNAFFHPFQDNSPPKIDPIPFSHDPYKKGLLHS